MMSIYCRNWWDLGYIRRLYILEGFYWENELARVFYWKYVFGGFNKRIMGGIYHSLMKLGVFLNTP